MKHNDRPHQDFGVAFVGECRRLLRQSYLPRIDLCAKALSDADIWWRPQTGTNSIGNLILHLEGNARQWILAGVCYGPDRRNRDAEFEAPQQTLPGRELLEFLTRTIAEVDSALEHILPESLLENREIQGNVVTCLEAILHVVEHFAMHTGQIILLTKQLTARDMHFYDL